MAKITTRVGLTNYILSQLGQPVINVEVTPEQISEIISDAIQRFTEYAWGDLEAVVLLQFEGIGIYTLPDTITNIIKVSQGSASNITNFSANFGAGYVPDMWSNQTSGSVGDMMPSIIAISNTTAVLDKYFGDDLASNFNPYKKTLNLLEDFTGPVAVHYQYEYEPDEVKDAIFNHEWIKDYTKAKVKFLWGQTTGKFSQSLVGGATINYSDMKSEAQQEIDKLDEELLNKWSDPAPIMVG